MFSGSPDSSSARASSLRKEASCRAAPPMALWTLFGSMSASTARTEMYCFSFST